MTSETTDDLRCAVPRADFDVDAAMAAVIPVCSAVRDRGVEALREYSEKFDHVVPEHLRVPVEARHGSCEPRRHLASGFQRIYSTSSSGMSGS